MKKAVVVGAFKQVDRHLAGAVLYADDYIAINGELSIEVVF